MERKIITTISESQHNLVGLGKITYTYERNGKPTLIIAIENCSKQIKFINRKATNLFHDLNIDIDNDIETVKSIAAFSCGIQLFRLYEKTRRTDVVFARFCVFWYLRTVKLKGVSNIGKLFNMNHATVLHGLKLFSLEPKFMSSEHRKYKSIFLAELKKRDLI